MNTTTFDNLARSGELFFLINDRMFALEPGAKMRNGRDYYHFIGLDVPLEESVSMAELEDLHIMREQDRIDEYVTKIINDRFISRVRASEKKLMKKASLYSSLKLDIVERFGLSVINEYLSLHRDTRLVDIDNLSNKPDINIRQFKQSDMVVPSIDDLLGHPSSLFSLTSGRGFFFSSGQVYECLPDSDASRQSEFIHFSGKNYSMKYHSNIDKFNSAYKKRIDDKIARIVMKKSGNYKRFLQEHENINDKIEQGIIKSKSIDELKNCKEVYYEKLGNNKDIYRFYIKRPAFIIEKYHEKIPYYFYFRRGFKAYVDVRIKNNVVRFSNRPKNALKGYNHPFVFDDNRICFGEIKSARKRWRNIGVEFCHDYDIRDKNTARKLALVLYEARMVGEYGYINEPLAVNKLFPPSLHFSDEYIGNDVAAARNLDVKICKNS